MPGTEIVLSLVVPALGLCALPAAERIGRNLRWDAATRAACAWALSFMWVELGAMALGFLGGLASAPITGWLLVGAHVSVWWGYRPRWAEFRPPLLPAAGTGVVVLLYLAVASVPAWQPDDMTYHLALARQHAMAGRFVRPDDNIFASLPSGWHTIQAALHTYGAAPDRFPPFCGRLITAWCSLGAAFATVGLARGLGVESRTAAWAAPLLLMAPTMFEYGSSGYVESYLILLTTLSLGCMVRVISRTNPSTPVEGRRELILAAVFCGMALSVKYTAVAFLVFGLIALLAVGLRRSAQDARRSLVWASLFTVVSVVAGSPFYVRNIIERGNPVFPTAFDIFGGTGWDTWRSWAYGLINGHYGQGKEWGDFLLLPLRIFTTAQLKDDFEGALGPMLGLAALMGALGAISSRRLPRQPIVVVVGFVAFWGVFWASTTQQLRFFLPVVPALVALCVVAVSMVPALARAGTAVVVVASMAWAAPVSNEIIQRQQTWAWLRGDISREELLSRMLPESYPVHTALEAIVPPNEKVWLVWMRAYTYYLRRPFRLDCVFESWRFDALIDDAETVPDIAAALSNDGFRWVLVNERFMRTEESKESRAGRTQRILDRYDQLQRDGYFIERFRWRSIKLFEVHP